MKKEVVLTATGAGTLYIVAGLIYEMYRCTYCRDVNPLLRPVTDKKTHGEAYYSYRKSHADELQALPHTTYEILSSRGVKLVGRYYQWGKEPAGKIAVIVHGYRSDGTETAGMFFEYYRNRGIDLFSADNAGAGQSEGRTMQWGTAESCDLLLWIDFLKKRYGENIELILHGFSMGGATVANVSGRCPPNVKFIVDDSGYSSAKDILASQTGPMLQLLLQLNRLVTGMNLEEDAEIRKNILHAGVPMLFIHGEEDPTVPIAMGKELYHLCPTEKDYLWVPGARHIESMFVAPEKYAEKLDSFIGKYI